jgi:phosphoribosylglycinamide formyltransferase 1
MSLKIAILVSGRGSNLEAILEAVKSEKLDAKIQAVVSNKEGVAALDIAKRFGIEGKVIPSSGLSREEHEKLIHNYLKDFEIDYLVLAGYMRILSPYLLRKYQDERGFYRVVNIHPSLLPAFPGKDAYQDAFDYGVKVSGITIHLVDEDVDRGPILAQESFPRLPGDTIEDFKARGLAIEHVLYPAVLKQLAEQQKYVRGGSSKIAPARGRQ